MKHGPFYIFSFFVLLCMLVSCSIEKRRYTSGFHIEWHDEQSSRQIRNADLYTEVESAQVPTDSTIKHEESQETSSEALMEPKLNEPVVMSNRVEKNPSDNSHATKKTLQSRQPKTTRILRNFLGSKTFSLAEGAAQSPPPVDTSELDPVGMALGMIGFVFALVALACFITALFIATGWAALGYISIGFIGAVLAGIFAWIAQGIFMTHHQGIPWFQWLGLIIGLVGFYALIRIIFKI